MPVVNIADAALAMVLDPVHRVATEAERRDRRAVRPSQVVRRGALRAEPRAYATHRAGEHLDRAAAIGEDEPGGLAVAKLGDYVACRLRQPHFVRLAVLRAGPAVFCIGRTRQGPPAISYLVVPHVRHFTRPLAGQQ